MRFKVILPITADIFNEEIKDVPVIDPVFAATRMLESFIAMRVKQSRLTYMTPPSKERVKS
jgi:Asp/Glu/hydantoin racemase